MARPVVTIDGLAGSGKTTLARRFAERCGFVHLNSGLLYRAVGFLSLLERVDPNDETALVAMVRRHRIELVLESDRVPALRIDGIRRGDELQTPAVSEATSLSSQYAGVRAQLLAAQREAFPEYPLVAEGRDMGTVVFPDADLKFFVVAAEPVRVERRLTQLRSLGSGLAADEAALRESIRIEIFERDQRDAHRSVSPTVAAVDAITIDNSSQTLTEVVESMYSHALTRGILSSEG